MKLALVGYGAMGRMVHEAARAASVEIGAIVDPHAPEATAKELKPEALKGCSTVIDFTLPKSVLLNIPVYCEVKCPAVIGTTGWYESLPQVEKQVRASGSSLLWASNFSIGVHVYLKTVEACAKLVSNLEEFDIWATELHHRNKADSPSGTAKSAAKVILDNVSRKKRVVYDKLDRKIERDEFHFSSVRGGEVNFEHTIGFDTDSECITIKHAARNRSGYAKGALAAARWIEQQPPGLYDMESFVAAMLKGRS